MDDHYFIQAFEKIENPLDELKNEYNEWKKLRDVLFMSIDKCLSTRAVSKDLSHLIFSFC